MDYNVSRQETSQKHWSISAYQSMDLAGIFFTFLLQCLSLGVCRCRLCFQGSRKSLAFRFQLRHMCFKVFDPISSSVEVENRSVRNDHRSGVSFPLLIASISALRSSYAVREFVVVRPGCCRPTFLRSIVATRLFACSKSATIISNSASFATTS